MSTTQQDTPDPSVNHAIAQAHAERERLIQQIQAAVDLITATPELTLSAIDIDRFESTVTIRDYAVDTAADLARVSRAIGGRWDKRESDTLFALHREIADGIFVELVASRGQVCERVVVGTETVEVPDPDAPKVTVERDVVEWRCAPILADREPQTA